MTSRNSPTLRVLCASAVPFLLVSALAAAEDPNLSTGSEFRKALESPLRANWNFVPVRRIVRRLGETHHVAVLLDRRVDPSQEPKLAFNGEPLAKCLDRIAASVKARKSVVGNTVLIGPKSSLDDLRTLVELRSTEFLRAVSDLPRGRAVELAARKTLRWDDLTSPQELLARLEENYDITIENSDAVPHDLWAGATIPDATLAEALSLILIQFDMTFAWGPKGDAVTVVPVPKRVRIERRHRIPRGTDGRALLEEWRKRLSAADLKLAGRELVAAARIEDHEAIEAALHPETRRTRPRAAERAPLSRRTFTLRLSDVPTSALMKKLEESDITFRYDAQALKDAGIDLDEPITLDIKDAKPEPFFEAVFGPLGLHVAISGNTVTLTPK